MKQLSKTGMFICGLLLGVMIMFNWVIYLTGMFTQDYVLLSFLGIITLIVIASFFQEEVKE